MRKTNVEIEFKTSISKEKYLELLKHFDLEDNIFKQTNYYFDTNELELNNKQMVLRIRQKDNRFKVTLKNQSGNNSFENHVLLKEQQAKQMIKEGFNTKDFFDEIDYFVTFKSSLDNYRVSTPYKEGVLFLDKCDYSDVVEFEVEYEVAEYDTGKKIFDDFLAENNIEFVKTKRKSQRALSKIKL